MLAVALTAKFPRCDKATRGFTLIELMVVISIIAILSTLAVPSFRAMANNQALSSASSELLSALIQARSTALKVNRRTIVQPTSSNDWRTGWLVYVDMNTNATYDAGTDSLILTRESLASDIAIGSLSGTGESQSSVTLFGFDGDGFLANVGGSFSGSVQLKSSYTAREKIVSVSRVGRGRICDPKLTPGCEP